MSCECVRPLVSGIQPLAGGTKGSKAMSDTDQKREDDVLRRMLKTPPKPHKDSKVGRKRESGQSAKS